MINFMYEQEIKKIKILHIKNRGFINKNGNHFHFLNLSRNFILKKVFEKNKKIHIKTEA